MIYLKFSKFFKIFQLTILMFIIFIAIFINGCNSSSKKQAPPPSPSSITDNEEIPDELKEIESKIDDIVTILNGPIEYKENKQKGKNKEEDNATTGNQNNDGRTSGKDTSDEGTKSNQINNQQNNGNQENNQGDVQQKGGNQTNITPKEQPQNQSIIKNDGTNVQTNSVDEKSWQDAFDDLKSIHLKWNDYMPKAVSVHIGTHAIESFSNALNYLTNVFREKDRIKTLIAVNEAYYYITDFYKFYKNKISPELKKIKYYTRDIILESITNNWNKTDGDLSNLEYSWNLSKTTIPREEDEKSDKLDMAILEFSKVIKEKNSELINIKGALLLKNLQDFENNNEQ